MTEVYFLKDFHLSTKSSKNYIGGRFVFSLKHSHKSNTKVYCECHLQLGIVPLTFPFPVGTCLISRVFSMFFFACFFLVANARLYCWFGPSVCLSVCLLVHLFFHPSVGSSVCRSMMLESKSVCGRGGVDCPCPPLRPDIVTQRYLFSPDPFPLFRR